MGNRTAKDLDLEWNEDMDTISEKEEFDNTYAREVEQLEMLWRQRRAYKQSLSDGEAMLRAIESKIEKQRAKVGRMDSTRQLPIDPKDETPIEDDEDDREFSNPDDYIH